MAVYLIDTENVSMASMEYYITHHAEKMDMIGVLYTEKNKILWEKFVLEMMQEGRQVLCQPVVTGSANALDFQMATMIGQYIGSGMCQGQDIIMVTSDKGYDCITKFMKDRTSTRIYRLDLKEVETEEQQQYAGEIEKARKNLQNRMKECTKEITKQILKYHSIADKDYKRIREMTKAQLLKYRKTLREYAEPILNQIFENLNLMEEERIKLVRSLLCTKTGLKEESVCEQIKERMLRVCKEEEYEVVKNTIEDILIPICGRGTEIDKIRKDEENT